VSKYTDAIIAALEERDISNAITDEQKEDAHAPWRYYEQGVHEALATLSEREQEVISYRLKEGFTLETTGKIMRITKERVRQIEAKALTKLSHPLRRQMMRCVPYAEYLRVTFQLETASIEIDWLKSAAGAFIARIKPVDRPVANPVDFVYEATTDIADLGLSVRTYNCLFRSHNTTVGDILELSINDMLNIRNFGMKSITETIDILHKMGACPDFETVRKVPSTRLGKIQS
jgi:hypothetical protein